jgi:hypothetical protein
LRSKTKTEAIITAMEQHVRRKELESIISIEGTLRFSDEWEKARHER